MDTVSKSQLVGLQETARTALETMRGTKEQTATNKTIAIVGGVVLALIIIGAIVGGVIMVSRRKKVAAVS